MNLLCRSGAKYIRMRFPSTSYTLSIYISYVLIYSLYIQVSVYMYNNNGSLYFTFLLSHISFFFPSCTMLRKKATAIGIRRTLSTSTKAGAKLSPNSISP